MDIKNIKKQGYKIKKQTIKIERKNDGYFIL
jgi:DNA-binding winged helix-turn-helix (wHTH) protein